MNAKEWIMARTGMSEAEYDYLDQSGNLDTILEGLAAEDSISRRPAQQAPPPATPERPTFSISDWSGLLSPGRRTPQQIQRDYDGSGHSVRSTLPNNQR